MNIAVCIRQVPSTETRITVSPETNRVDLKSVDWVVNPYDEYALEAALRLREERGGTVTALALGPERVRTVLKTALALGVDRVELVAEPETVDSGVAARLLAAAVKRGGYDLVLTGLKGVDDDMAYVGPALAERLDLPHVSSVTRLELSADGKSARVNREIEGATEVIEVLLPAVLTAQKGLNEPRYPSLRGLMLAGKKEIPVCPAAELELEPGARTTQVSIRRATLPPERKAGRRIEGTASDAVRELVRALREEAKVV